MITTGMQKTMVPVQKHTRRNWYKGQSVVVLVGITIYTNKVCISVLSNYEMVCVEVSHGSLLCI